MQHRFRIDEFPSQFTATWILEALKQKSMQSLQIQDIPLTGITTDSRLVQKGDCFVPLVGNNQNGHQFITAAVKQGAAIVLCNHDDYEQNKNDFPKGLLLVVNDTLECLGLIAKNWRQQFDIPFIGITGSNGKTTTRAICESILSQKHSVLATWKNWNNEIGLPLTLLRLRNNHQLAIVEMGMNAPGEISRLTSYCMPTIRTITNIMPVHLELLGDIEGVSQAKAEITEGIQPDDVFAVNLDDERVVSIAKKIKCEKIYFSYKKHPRSEIYLKSVVDQNAHFSTGTLCIRGGSLDFKLNIPGDHNLRNMLAATSLAIAVGAHDEEIVAGIKSARSANMRSEWKNVGNDIHLFIDCYNANPQSMSAAFDLMRIIKQRKFALLGDMAELGEHSGHFHQETLCRALNNDFDKVFTYGSRFLEAGRTLDCHAKLSSFTDIAALIDALSAELQAGDYLLVKGSRAMTLEKAIAELEQALNKGVRI